MDPIEHAEFPKAIRLMPGITPTHSRDGAKLWKPKAATEPFIFMADESVVEIDVVGDEYPVAHELHKAVRDFREYRRIANHLVRDVRDLR